MKFYSSSKNYISLKFNRNDLSNKTKGNKI